MKSLKVTLLSAVLLALPACYFPQAGVGAGQIDLGAGGGATAFVDGSMRVTPGRYLHDKGYEASFRLGFPEDATSTMYGARAAALVPVTGPLYGVLGGNVLGADGTVAYGFDAGVGLDVQIAGDHPTSGVYLFGEAGYSALWLSLPEGAEADMATGPTFRIGVHLNYE